jgi:hypothetical protein
MTGSGGKLKWEQCFQSLQNIQLCGAVTLAFNPFASRFKWQLSTFIFPSMPGSPKVSLSFRIFIFDLQLA